MAGKRQVAKKGPPLTVGMLRKAIEKLPDSSLVVCDDTERQFGRWVADSVEVGKYIYTDSSLKNASPVDKASPNSEEEIFLELKDPVLIIVFVRPEEEKRA